MNYAKRILLATAPFVASFSFGQVYSLTEQSFDNPEFRARFVASYVASSDVNPSISASEKTLFDEIVPLIQSSPKAAIEKLRAGVTPESSAAFNFILGNLLYQEDDSKGSVAEYKAAIKKFPNYFRAHYNLGRAYVALGEYADGLASLQKALSIQSGDSALYGLIGYCYINLEQPSTALDAYRQAIMLNPKSRDWKMGKLQCLIQLGQNDEAIGLLYEFIKDEPVNADWWKLQANQFLAKKENGKAAANLTVVREIGKADGASLTLLGDLMLNEGLIDEALDSYIESLGKNGSRPGRMIEIVNSLIMMDELDAAKNLESRVSSVIGGNLSEPQKLDLLNAKARIALKSDNLDAAASFLEEIVKKDPLNGAALLSLSDLEKQRGDMAKAEYYAESASKIDRFAHKALLSLAQLNVSKRDYSTAAKYLRQAQQIDPREYVADYLTKVEQAAMRM